ncbi:hypothetical protein [Aeromicrobium sp.]|uniref:hypothetical protein n=1 Tax=Aeromicrobium sp. TaxID=1871063 RepID=UPI001993F434|nr:hypothetical protein [Aeromicrobium sp.]MBC7630321.1 hypothetical protein [Aeromicrobium sp.]
MLAGLSRLRLPAWAHTLGHLRVKATDQPRATMSLWSGIVFVLLGLAYTEPDRYARRAPLPGQIGIVQQIEQIGPFWSVGFCSIGVLLLICTFLGRGLVIAHLLGQAIAAGYAIALWFSALAMQPPSPVIAAVLATVFALLQKACRDSYVNIPKGAA